MDGDIGQAGVQDLGETVSRVWAAEPPGTLHLTLNAAIDESGSQPTVTSTLLLLAPASLPPIVGSASVRQAVRKTPAGWRVAARTISMQPSPSSLDLAGSAFPEPAKPWASSSRFAWLTAAPLLAWWRMRRLRWASS